MINSPRTNRLPIGHSVIEFWQNSYTTRPELCKLASIMFAIPPTEVICEQHFSTLNFVYNKLRNSLSDESLQRILFIKLNFELLDM